MIKTVKPETLKSWLNNNEVYLIDVREIQEYNNENIKQSHLVPLAQFSADVIPNDAKKIVIHCRSGMRSARACELALAQNPNLDIFNLEGGILAWNAAGYEIVKPFEKKTFSLGNIPLDGQVRLFAGIFILFTLFISAHLLTAAIALGLVFSGLTGWCGMAKCLQKMPWNNKK